MIKLSVDHDSLKVMLELEGSADVVVAQFGVSMAEFLNRFADGDEKDFIHVMSVVEDVAIRHFREFLTNRKGGFIA